MKKLIAPLAAALLAAAAIAALAQPSTFIWTAFNTDTTAIVTSYVNLDPTLALTGTGKNFTLTPAGLATIDDIKDQNSGNIIKRWYGTQTEYDAITTKDPLTEYNIYEDTALTTTALGATALGNLGDTGKTSIETPMIISPPPDINLINSETTTPLNLSGTQGTQ